LLIAHIYYLKKGKIGGIKPDPVNNPNGHNLKIKNSQSGSNLKHF